MSLLFLLIKPDILNASLKEGSEDGYLLNDYEIKYFHYIKKL